MNESKKTVKIIDNSNSYDLFKRLFAGYITPHRRTLLIAILCMLVVSVCTSGASLIIQPIIDELFVNKNQSMMYIIPAALVGIYVVKGIAGYFQQYLVEKVGQRMIADLQKDLYAHVVHQDLSFHQEYPAADLSSRFIYDLTMMKAGVSRAIVGIMRDFPMIIGLVSVMLYHNWKLALATFTIVPVAIVPIILFGRHIRKSSRNTQTYMGELSTILKESLGHIRQVKTYTNESYEIQRSSRTIDGVLKNLLRVARYQALSSPVMELLGGIMTAGIILYGSTLVLNEELTTGQFMSFLTAAMMIYRPLKSISSMNNVLQQSLAAAERAFDLIDRESLIKNKETATDIHVTKGSIHFKDVAFAYADGTKATEHLNLEIPAGQTVALVGASGAGKSTVLNLIPRFFDVSEGSIEIDGVDVRDFTLKSLRDNIALVTQDVAIFDDTVTNNILYGKADATMAEVEKAAQDAAADKFIEQLPFGYDTIVGDDGNSLSGGQKQRISIARAMLKNAPILLLDEATSSLDTESEKSIQKALDKLCENRTTLIVAHRLSTIRNADCIYVLDKGKIIESGTHEALLKKGGAYKKLHDMQEDVV